MPDSLAPQFASFLSRFRTAMKKRMPDATLVVALGAGASGSTIERIERYVDQIFLMAYDYRTTRSSTAGPVAPLDARWLSVRLSVERYLRHAPPGKVILGMPAYGYDWPVSGTAANASVRRDHKQVGVPFSVTLAAINKFLDIHPTIPVRYDGLADSPYFTYHDHLTNTYRQVWFEDARSLGRKMDLALSSRLAGVGIWALDADPSFAAVWDVVHRKLSAPSHKVVVKGSLFHVTNRGGRVEADITASVQNRGTVPEAGQLGWAVRDSKGKLVASGHIRLTVDSRGARKPLFHVVLGSSATLRAGTYRLTLVFGAGGRHWAAPKSTFKQKF